jgi:hypothetical protein
MNVDFCVLIDMKIPSGKKHFFLWDLNGDSFLKSRMCSNRSCGNLSGYDSDKSPQFSNVPENHCSSLGKYKIGNRGPRFFEIRINYKFHGLEKTNSNACKRIIFFILGESQMKKFIQMKLLKVGVFQQYQMSL